MNTHKVGGKKEPIERCSLEITKGILFFMHYAKKFQLTQNLPMSIARMLIDFLNLCCIWGPVKKSAKLGSSTQPCLTPHPPVNLCPYFHFIFKNRTERRTRRLSVRAPPASTAALVFWLPLAAIFGITWKIFCWNSGWVQWTLQELVCFQFGKFSGLSEANLVGFTPEVNNWGERSSSFDFLVHRATQ